MPNLEVAVSSSNAPERPLPKYCASKIWYVLFLCLPMMFGPNITGYTGAAWDDTSGDVTGAFYFSGDAAESANGLRGRYGISFDASRVNSAYSRSRTVQPASVRSLYCIKS